jgi:hypothetical protein
MNRMDFRSRSKIFVLLWLTLILGTIPSCTKNGGQVPAETSTTLATVPSVPQPVTAKDTAPTAAKVEEPSVSKTAPAEGIHPGAAKDEKQRVPKAASAKSAESGVARVEGQSKTVGNSSALVPIDIVLPKPLFIGTPQNIVVKNLEKPLGKPRPPFLAPAGTINVAAGKRVTSSDKSPIIGELELITDGNKDSSDGNYVQFGPGVQYITIDLGRTCAVYAIVIWHLHKQPVVFYDVIVQTAEDENFIENVKTLFNNDIDNSAGMGIGTDMHYTETNEGKLIDAKGVKTRYIRLYSNGYSLADTNYYTEVEVYGQPVS